MRIMLKAVTAGIIFLGSASFASAGGALDELGLEGAGEVPDASASAAEERAPDAAAKQAAPDIDLFRYFGYGKVVKAEAAPEENRMAEKGEKGAGSESVASVDLEAVKNAYLKPSVVFTTGSGTKVYISGTKASNCPDGGNSCKDKQKFFLVVTTEGNQSFFVRAVDVLNWGMFCSGSQTVTIDGEKYVVRIYVAATDPKSSKLEVSGPKGVVLSVTLKQVGDAVALKGEDVKLSRAYKLAYGNEIVQGPQGARFTSKLLVLMLPFPVVDASSYFIIEASQVTTSGVTFPSFEPAYGFRREGGMLEIYRL